MSTTIDTLLPQILPWAKAVPEQMAIDSARLAIIEFCRRTHVWRDTIEMSVITDKSLYEPQVGCAAQVVGVVGVSISGREIDPITEQELDNHSQRWRSDSGTPIRWLMDSPTTIRLYKTPDTTIANGMEVRAAVVPKRTDTEVDDFLINLYSEELADGALARLLAMPDKPWSNGKRAAVHRADFEVAIDQCLLQVRKSFTDKSLTVQPVRFF